MRKAGPLVGRRRELIELSEAFEAAARSERASVVLLAGEAGVGKSRLAGEALEQSGFAVHAGRAREEATPPYGPIVTALRSCMRRSAGLDDLPRPLATHLALLLPELGPAAAESPPGALTEAIAAALTGALRTGPTALLLEDLQWADGATVDLLPPLVERLDRSAFLVLGTYRNEELSRGHPVRRLRNELRRSGHLRELAIDPLDREECAALVEATLGAAPAPSLSGRVFELTGGVPLYVEELAGALAEAGGLRTGEHGLETAPGDSLPIPETIRDAVLLRLDGLSKAARSLLEAAAVVGTEFDVDLVGRLAASDGALDELIARQWVIERTPGTAAFRHALIRETVKGEITWSRQRSLHRRLAALLAAAGARPGLIAEHWLAARDLAAARDAWIESADQSCRVHAYRDAARDAGRALEIWPAGEDEPRRADVLERLAHCAQVTGQLGEAIRVLRELLTSPELEGDDRRRGAALRVLAESSALVGAWEQSIDASRSAAAAFEAAALPAEAATELLALADRYAAAVRVPLGLEAVRRAVSLAETAGRIDLRAQGLSLEGLLLAAGGEAPVGIRTIKAALELALEHGLTDAAAEAHRRLGIAYSYNSDYRTAGKAFSEAVQFCQTHGNQTQRKLCLGCMAWAHFQMGDWQRAGDLCRQVRADKETPAGLRAIALGVLGLVKAHRGELRPARRLLEQSAALTRPHETVAMELIVLGGLAGVAESEADPEQAERLYRRLLELWSQSDDRLDAAGGLCAAASFFAQRGLEAEVARCVEALSQMAATGNPEARAAFAFGLGETALLSDDAPSAAELFSRALANLEGLELPLFQATTALRAGVTLIRAGDREGGVERLRDAHRLARKLGARPLAGRIASELAAHGATAGEPRSPRAASRASRAGLTRRQLKVLRLIAEGLTNREIGERLFVSTRTVDMHVRNLLDRLDCRSRTEAVSKASTLGLLA